MNLMSDFKELVSMEGKHGHKQEAKWTIKEVKKPSKNVQTILSTGWRHYRNTMEAGDLENLNAWTT